MALNIAKLGKAAAMRAAGSAAGGALGQASNKFLPFTAKPRGLIKLLIGAVLPELSPKMKILDYVGSGLAGQAAGELLVEFVPSMATPASASGIGADAGYITDTDVSGQDDDVIYGTDDVISGDDDNVEGQDDPIAGLNDTIQGPNDEVISLF